MTKSIDVTPESVRYFRARRSHLAGPGAPDLASCARDIVGAQAQVETCALHALSLRTAGRPDADQVSRALLDEHALVRTWGQRDTLHIYSADLWPTIIAARPAWVISGRRGGMPSEAEVERARQFFAQADTTLTRSDLFDIISDEYVAELEDHQGAGRNPRRFAATRLVWRLAMDGHIVFAGKAGREQAYAHRDLHLGHVEPVEASPEEAAAEITRRYLSVFGPAHPRDVAHYVGACVGDCRKWMKLLDGELVACKCDGKKGLVALARDADELRRTPSQVGDDWPARMLPGYDTMLMTHKDKRWILPDADEEPLVWKKAAAVAPTIIAEGQIVATWSHNKRTHEVDVEVTPLGGWRASLRDEVEREAQEFAAHLGLELGGLEVVNG